MAFKWMGDNGLKGLAGVGLRRAAIRLLAVAVAASADKKCGIWVCWGKKSAVSAMQCPPVQGTSPPYHMGTKSHAHQDLQGSVPLCQEVQEVSY
eukprot:7942391-Ditylum_brightwellii.AAC.1